MQVKSGHNAGLLSLCVGVVAYITVEGDSFELSFFYAAVSPQAHTAALVLRLPLAVAVPLFSLLVVRPNFD